MKVGNMKQSRFISKSDLPEPPYGMVVTIGLLNKENVASPDAPPELKYTLKFNELPKPFVLNMTNAESIALVLGSEETDHWVGGKIELYYDPNIMMGPKKTGGIRIRPPAGQAPSPAAPTVPGVATNVPAPAFDDDIPL